MIRKPMCLFVLLLAGPTLAAVPGSLAYQAFLTDSGGAAIDGSATITF